MTYVIVSVGGFLLNLLILREVLRAHKDLYDEEHAFLRVPNQEMVWRLRRKVFNWTLLLIAVGTLVANCAYYAVYGSY